ncbi:MAG: hypothetical protein BA873_03075 [Desulfobulbaceae bacterium C00003063]|nr:MAG: hypothetical protein BA873_03075 [Desulfobulbaceae bacterium C00003063]
MRHSAGNHPPQLDSHVLFRVFVMGFEWFLNRFFEDFGGPISVFSLTVNVEPLAQTWLPLAHCVETHSVTFSAIVPGMHIKSRQGRPEPVNGYQK